MKDWIYYAWDHSGIPRMNFAKFVLAWQMKIMTSVMLRPIGVRLCFLGYSGSIFEHSIDLEI